MFINFISQIIFVSFAVCNQAADPHSFDCADETFFGKHFPVLEISENLVNGSWKLLTFATVEGFQSEFTAMTSSQNSNIPKGVLNSRDQSLAGPLVWQEDQVEFKNWTQKNFALESQKTSSRDAWTLQTIFPLKSGAMSLQCRLFDRKGAHHLLCLWFEKDNGPFQKLGYLGFLKL